MKDLKPLISKGVYMIYTLLIIYVIFLIYRRYSLSGEFIAYSILIIMLTMATITDIKKMIIPNKLLIVGFCISILAMFINKEVTILSSILGGTISGGAIWALSYLTKGGIGLGDVKLIAVIGLFVGLVNIFSILMFSTIFSGLLGIILLVFKIRDKKDSLPFAPFILIGTILVLLIN